MKKILTAIAALAMVAGLASCQKENVIDNGGSNKTTITARFADTKVSYSESGNDLKPSWESGDKVLGLTSGGETFTLEVTSISGNVATLQGSDVPEGSVRLIYVSGISSAKYDSANKKYVISYNCQKGDKTMPAIMTADGTIDHGCGEFIFDNAGAVLGISNVGTALNGKAIKQVTLYGKELASSADVSYSGVTFNYANKGYNVISTKVLGDITVGGDGTLNKNILMAVPAGAEVDSVFIRTTDGEVYSLGSSNKDPMTASTYRYIKNANFKRDAYRDAMILTGVFSTDESGENQVFFSKGNLRYTTTSSKWSFFDKQYDCGPEDYESGHNTEISLFTWGYGSWSISPNTKENLIGYSKDENFGSSDDWGTGIDNKGTWRTPTVEEWIYLVPNEITEGDFRYGFYKSSVEVFGKTNHVVIAPDGWDLTSNPLQAVYNSTSTPMTWEEAEAAGLVCLPPAGYRDEDAIGEVYEKGYYWSSTSANLNKGYDMDFDCDEVSQETKAYRNFGYSVRLVSECK